MVGQGTVTEVTIKGSQVTGRFVPADKDSNQSEKNAQANSYFNSTIPAIEDPKLLPLLEEKGVIIHAETEERSWLATILITMLPWVLLIGFFVYSSKKLVTFKSYGINGFRS
jgi:cell division protease FtsH